MGSNQNQSSLYLPSQDAIVAPNTSIGSTRFIPEVDVSVLNRSIEEAAKMFQARQQDMMLLESKQELSKSRMSYEKELGLFQTQLLQADENGIVHTTDAEGKETTTSIDDLYKQVQDKAKARSAEYGKRFNTSTFNTDRIQMENYSQTYQALAQRELFANKDALMVARAQRAEEDIFKATLADIKGTTPVGDLVAHHEQYTAHLQNVGGLGVRYVTEQSQAMAVALVKQKLAMLGTELSRIDDPAERLKYATLVEEDMAENQHALTRLSGTLGAEATAIITKDMAVARANIKAEAIKAATNSVQAASTRFPRVVDNALMGGDPEEVRANIGYIDELLRNPYVQADQSLSAVLQTQKLELQGAMDIGETMKAARGAGSAQEAVGILDGKLKSLNPKDPTYGMKTTALLKALKGFQEDPVTAFDLDTREKIIKSVKEIGYTATQKQLQELNLPTHPLADATIEPYIEAAARDGDWATVASLTEKAMVLIQQATGMGDSEARAATYLDLSQLLKKPYLNALNYVAKDKQEGYLIAALESTPPSAAATKSMREILTKNPKVLEGLGIITRQNGPQRADQIIELVTLATYDEMLREPGNHALLKKWIATPNEITAQEMTKAIAFKNKFLAIGEKIIGDMTFKDAVTMSLDKNQSARNYFRGAAKDGNIGLNPWKGVHIGVMKFTGSQGTMAMNENTLVVASYVNALLEGVGYKSMNVTSAYRNKSLNAAAKSRDGSHHAEGGGGDALDLDIRDSSPRAVEAVHALQKTGGSVIINGALLAKYQAKYGKHYNVTADGGHEDHLHFHPGPKANLEEMKNNFYRNMSAIPNQDGSVSLHHKQYGEVQRVSPQNWKRLTGGAPPKPTTKAPYRPPPTGAGGLQGGIVPTNTRPPSYTGRPTQSGLTE